uniref:Transducin family protein n=1 Tax=Rhizophora mucronata TaxID=61149 RepID=A0A2P2JEI7_RHIMU
MLVEPNGKHDPFDKSSWIVTGCEDGTVRLTRFTPGVNSCFTSKFLGEHVGGSAVRAIYYVSKVHSSDYDITNLSDWKHGRSAPTDDKDNPVLLISVGAKRVLTSWLLRERTPEEKEKSLVIEEQNKDGNEYFHYSGVSSLISFKWLSTDMPVKNSSTHGKAKDIGEMNAITENVSKLKTDAASRSCLLRKGDAKLQNCLYDKCEDDWRYLSVTAFLVKHTGSRLIICFVVVACSDATLALRALILPHRLWYS